MILYSKTNRNFDHDFELKNITVMFTHLLVDQENKFGDKTSEDQTLLSVSVVDQIKRYTKFK